MSSRQREVADELPDDGDLLGVLLAERRDVRLHHVEQNQTDRRDAVEVPGPVRAFVPFGRSAHPDDRGVARRVDLLDGGHEQTSAPAAAAQIAASCASCRG